MGESNEGKLPPHFSAIKLAIANIGERHSHLLRFWMCIQYLFGIEQAA